MRNNNFDFVAPFYDSLAQLFFGNSLRKAQTHFISRIKPNSTILVLGSGTGWIANEILKIHPNSKITLVDASQKMTDIARKKLHDKPVEIICSNEQHEFQKSFDVIILPFFLDMFPTEKLNQVLDSVSRNLNQEGLILATEFVSKKWWHNVYLSVMYLFFKVTTSIEVVKLPYWTIKMNERFELIDESSFYNGFINTRIHRKHVIAQIDFFL